MDMKTSPLAQLNDPSLLKTDALINGQWVGGSSRFAVHDPATGQKADGFVWGVPRDVSTFALYLNLDLIDKAGVDDPRQLAADGKWTWDAFDRQLEYFAAQKLLPQKTRVFVDFVVEQFRLQGLDKRFSAI